MSASMERLVVSVITSQQAQSYSKPEEIWKHWHCGEVC
jgi:hypothetical protein